MPLVAAWVVGLDLQKVTWQLINCSILRLGSGDRLRCIEGSLVVKETWWALPGGLHFTKINLSSPVLIAKPAPGGSVGVLIVLLRSGRWGHSKAALGASEGRARGTQHPLGSPLCPSAAQEYP